MRKQILMEKALYALNIWTIIYQGLSFKRKKITISTVTTSKYH